MLIKKVGKSKTISVRVREDLLDMVVDLRAELADHGYTLHINRICATAIENAVEQGRRELEDLRRKAQGRREI